MVCVYVYVVYCDLEFISSSHFKKTLWHFLCRELSSLQMLFLCASHAAAHLPCLRALAGTLTPGSCKTNEMTKADTFTLFSIVEGLLHGIALYLRGSTHGTVLSWGSASCHGSLSQRVCFMVFNCPKAIHSSLGHS